MSRIAYVNGRYRPHREAMIHVEDRGYQFRDGVYEVCEVRAGRLVDERRHMARLTRSLDELRIDLPMPLAGAGRRPARDRAPQPGARRHRLSAGDPGRRPTRPRLSATRHRAVDRRHRAHPRPRRGRTRSPPKGSRSSPCRTPAGHDPTSSRCRCCPMSWPSSRPASRARAKPGSSMPRDLYTEGASSNAWIVTAGGEVVTRPADNRILNGISRAVVLDVIAASGLRFVERAFSVAEARVAREAFVTAASQIVQPVVRIDGTAGGRRTAGAGRHGVAARIPSPCRTDLTPTRLHSRKNRIAACPGWACARARGAF